MSDNEGVRYTRSKDARQLVGASLRMPSGQWAPRPSILEHSDASERTIEIGLLMSPDAPLFDTDYEAAEYAMKVAVGYSTDHPEPLA